jgi:hypothetical protein
MPVTWTKAPLVTHQKRMHAKVKELVDARFLAGHAHGTLLVRLQELTRCGVTEVMLFLCTRNMLWHPPLRY